MQQGPKGRIRKTFVILIVVLSEQRHSHIGDLALGYLTHLIGYGSVHLPRLAKPNPAHFTQRVFYSNRQSAGTDFALFDRGYSVRYNEQTAQNASSQLLLSRIAHFIRPTIE